MVWFGVLITNFIVQEDTTANVFEHNTKMFKIKNPIAQAPDLFFSVFS